MGFTTDRPLEDLFPGEDFAREVAQETAERVAVAWRDEVEDRTPEAEIPAAYKGNYSAWVRDRKGRRPGTLKDSWRRSRVTVRSAAHVSVSVYTDDPVAPHVEWDTRPHVIRARKPGGYLRFPYGLEFVFRRQVRHPGTTGVHMMRDSAAEIEILWPEIANEVIAEKAGVAERV